MNSIDGWTHLMEKANLIILLRQSVLVKIELHLCPESPVEHFFTNTVLYIYNMFNGNRNRLEKHMRVLYRQRQISQSCFFHFHIELKATILHKICPDQFTRANFVQISSAIAKFLFLEGRLGAGLYPQLSFEIS